MSATAADLSALRRRLRALERGGAAFARSFARADEVRRPGADPRQKPVAKAAMPRGRNFR